jgi:hypothetical protein
VKKATTGAGIPVAVRTPRTRADMNQFTRTSRRRISGVSRKQAQRQRVGLVVHDGFTASHLVELARATVIKAHVAVAGLKAERVERKFPGAA